MKREADLPIHSFLPATCPTSPILPHPTKPSPTEKQKTKTKNQKPKKGNGQQQTTQNLFSLSFTHLLLLFSTIYKYLWSIATTIPIVIGKFEFHFSLRACMHKQVPSHLTSVPYTSHFVPYTFHSAVLTHTVGIRYLMYLYFLQSTLFVVVIANTQHTTYNIQDRTGRQVGTLLGWAGR